MSSIHIRIKELRNEKELSVKDLADFFYVTVRAVQRWETGENVPDIDTIIRLARFFEVTTDYLLGVTD